MPFLPLLFQSRGLSPTEIASVMFLVPVASLLVPSLWGMIADALHARVLLLRIAALGSCLSILLLYPNWKLAGSFLAMSFICFFRASVTPLADAAAHSMLAESHGRFASIRVWGSLGFSLCAGLGGWLEVSHHPERLVLVSASVYLVSVLVALRMDAPPIARRPQVLSRTMRFVMTSALPLVLLGTVFHYLGHSMYDVYFALHLRALGYDDGVIGLGWMIGSGSEVVLMLFGARILAAHDPRRLMALSTVIAIFRWCVLARVTDPIVIMASQLLHAFTFGLWYLSMVKFVQDESPDELRTSLQSIAISAMGLGSMFGYLLGGSIFEASGGSAVFRVAALAATGATACYAVLAFRSRPRALS